MASKGPRSKLDHDTRTRRQKALEAPKEPPRPKSHWDHVLEEMVWLSKDFESERKWKLAQAKKVSIRASKSVLDFATWGEKKVKEEEHRLKKVAINISKDVKKFWTKIEKLVLYKYQLELEERKKKALDKQLNFLLGQTERYSTMLAENLVDVHCSSRPVDVVLRTEEDLKKKDEQATEVENFESDDDYSIQSDDDLEDDEHTIEEDEAQITEAERRDELDALQAEADLPLEELLKSYDVREFDSESNKDLTESVMLKHQIKDCSKQVNGSVQDYEALSNITALPATNEEHYSVGNNHLHHGSHQLHHGESNGDSCLEKKLTVDRLEKEVFLEGLAHSGDDDSTHDPGNETDDGDYCVINEEEDDETTLAEEEELTKKDATDPLNEIMLLQQESEMPLEELIARYTKDPCSDDDIAESGCASSSSNEQLNSAIEQNDDQDNRSSAVSDGIFKLEKPTEHTQPDSAVKEEVEVGHDQAIDGRESEDIIADAAAAARSAQPTGNTFSTTKVRTKFPFLIKHPLREYQHIGLDWLVTMYEKRLNGILADEMGLGKTIMTIALLAHLACEKGIWGPHLIVVPTSVMLNWETEFLKWCPAFKILTYFGTAKERKHKRQGWLKPNYFHVCITTYRLVIQDSKVFKRKKWKYLILDEAHLIKNWKSQRWQTLLNFNAKRRILLTGTPLQNDLMELWSLMHFLMPHIFQSHQEFKDWFCNPISGMVEGQEKVNKEVVDRLHNVLRPFILRRLKRDVEKQLPQKHEHVINCRLSKRQRNLYEDFIASSETQATLASANFFGMISVIMQLRKVCNHPDLFEGRPIVSSFDMPGIDMQLSSLVCSILSSDPFSKVDLSGLNFLFTQNEFEMTSWEFDEVVAISSPPKFIQETGIEGTDVLPFCNNRSEQKRRIHGTNIFEEIQKSLWDERVKHLKERTASIAWWNSLQCQKKPVYGTNLRKLVSIKHPVFHIHEQKRNPSCYMDFSSKLTDIVLSPIERFHKMLDIIESFMFAIPASRAPAPICWCSKGRSPVFVDLAYKEECTRALSPLLSPVRPAIVRRQVYFPDRRLIQFDCGKLQELAVLLRCLKSEGHRALIFTQMTKMLDILEAFINLYGYTYLRLDGSTQPEERQTLMQRFNTNPKYFLFILSTRSGGVGINLVGADTVIFYDSDWNPAMDQQAQDRCHRIGQTREVHIYRLISESTIEENILKKANQKRALDDLVIQSGSYNTEFFKKLDPMDLFSGHETLKIDNIQKRTSNAAECSSDGMQALMINVDVEEAIKHAEDEVDYMALKRVEQEEEVDNQEFAEDGIGRPEDDELGNDDDMKHDERIAEDQRFQVAVQAKENVGTLQENHAIEENALTIAGGDEDIDMLADVKQMAAAAAAAGQASSSFENQLRPIDRYAMRFLELWDPIVDKSAIEHQVNVEEQEWELDRIEKFKEDLEAEIDEDQEPFLYERWDADFATTAYQQHVEALAQRQLLEELECEDLDTNEADENGTSKKLATSERKSKKKKKSKKTKLKSLKKGPPPSDVQAGETQDDPMFVDDDDLTPEDISHESPPPTQKKRRKSMNPMEEEEATSRKSHKKVKKGSESKSVECSDLSLKQHSETGETKMGEGANDLELKLPHKTKVGAKVSITYVPVKRIMLVKPEKLRKKGPPWSKDWLPPSDSWSSEEDAILCAVVHEYGTHWSLVSDALYSTPSGGLYRGRFRHPIHCSERFRELFSKYVLSAMDNSHSDKMNPGLGKALLKVTEDQVRVLLNVTSELPNKELLLQKHFVAVLSSVWRAKCRLERCQTLPSSRSSIYPSRVTSDSSMKTSQRLTEGMNSTNLRNCSRLVQSAIDDDFREQREMPAKPSSHLQPQASVDQLDLTLEFAMEQEDSETSYPYSFCVSIRCPEPLQQFSESLEQNLRPKTTRRIAENRFRTASEACIESEGSGWAQSAFLSVANNRHKSGSKSQTLGKHKSADSSRPSKSKVQRTTEPQEDTFSFTKSVIPSRRPTTFEFITPAEVLDLDYDQAFDSYCQDSQDTEFIPHNYDPSICSELDDIGPLMDFTDIG